MVNKIDLPEAADRLALLHELCPLDFPEYQISTTTGQGIEELRNVLYRALDIIRVYTKMPNKKEPDMDKPYNAAPWRDAARCRGAIHKDLAENLKHARIWGTTSSPAARSREIMCFTTRMSWRFTRTRSVGFSPRVQMQKDKTLRYGVNSEQHRVRLFKIELLDVTDSIHLNILIKSSINLLLQ